MARQPQPDRLEDIVRKLTSRIEKLERSPQLGNSSLLEGQVSALDGGGQRRTMIGQLEDRHFGVQVVTAQGDDVFRADDRGLIAPSLHYLVRPALTKITDGEWRIFTGSSTFDFIWSCRIENLGHPGLLVEVPFLTTGSFAGQIRLTGPGGNSPTAPAIITSGDNTIGLATFRWLHGKPLGMGPYDFTVEARVTGGTGGFGIAIYYPFQGFAGVTSDGCTPGGLIGVERDILA